MEELRTVRLSVGESVLLVCAIRVVLLLVFVVEALSELKLTLDASLLIVFSGARCLLSVLDTEELFDVVGVGFFGAGEAVLPVEELEVLGLC